MESPLVQALLLAVVNKGIVDYLAAPIKKAYANLDMWWLVYVSLVTGAGIGFISGLNLFVGTLDGLPGQVVTSILIGCGASLIHDVLDNEGISAKLIQALKK